MLQDGAGLGLLLAGDVPTMHLLPGTSFWLLPAEIPGLPLLPARLSAPLREVPGTEKSFLLLLHLPGGFPGWSLDAE